MNRRVALVAIGIAASCFPPCREVRIFAGLLAAAWANDSAHVGPWTLLVIGLIGAASYMVDFVAAALGARHVGASRSAVVGAALGYPARSPVRASRRPASAPSSAPCWASSA